MKSTGICLVLSAPSGGGKTTLLRALIDRFANMRHSISYTTREPRSDRSDLMDYKFTSDEDFSALIADGAFIEWAEVHGKKYGTNRQDLADLLESGFDVVMDIDIQGARRLMAVYEEAVYVFVMPPSLEILEKRLRNRQSETTESLSRRLENARSEILAYSEYDYVVVNDELETSIRQLEAILVAERIKTTRWAIRSKVDKLLEENRDGRKEA